MPEIEKFSHEMLIAYCKQRELSYLRDEEGDLRISFQGGPIIWLIAAGQDSNIASVQTHFDGLSIPPELYGDAIVACNDWNRDRRVPRAFLRVREDHGEIILDNHLPASPGIHQELLGDYLDWNISGSLEFVPFIKGRPSLAEVTGSLEAITPSASAAEDA